MFCESNVHGAVIRSTGGRAVVVLHQAQHRRAGGHAVSGQGLARPVRDAGRGGSRAREGERTQRGVGRAGLALLARGGRTPRAPPGGGDFRSPHPPWQDYPRTVSNELPPVAEARMAEIRRSGTWGSAPTSGELPAIRSVGVRAV